MVLWFTFSYCPIAHMVWFWQGPDAYTSKDVVDAMNAKRRPDLAMGRARLRRRHRGAHQRRRRRPGGRVHGRQAHRLRQGSVHAALADADDGRCLAAVGGLVRLQRRLGARSRRHRRAGLHQHLLGHRRGGAGLVHRRSADEGQGLDAGRRLGRRRRPGGDHAGLPATSA